VSLGEYYGERMVRDFERKYREECRDAYGPIVWTRFRVWLVALVLSAAVHIGIALLLW